MPNNLRSSTIILIASAAVICLAVLLFVNAISIGDFSQPGQSFLSGRSNMRLALAFALLTGLTLVLLIALSRTGRQRSAGRAPAGTAPGGKAGAAAGRIAEPAGAILSETAGEIRMAVEVIEEDYRKIEGRFDVFVSVGMLEHVGPENYHELGNVIDRVLAPDGRGLIHSINSSDRRDKCVMISAALAVNSIAKSRSDTASSEFSHTPSKPSSSATYSRLIG